jgi:hypothetical protein
MTSSPTLRITNMTFPRPHGDRFVTRLQLRWAIFFWTLGIGYSYQPGAFDLLSGAYRPHFHLPAQQAYVTILEHPPACADLGLAQMLADHTGNEVYLLSGPIHQPHWDVYERPRPVVTPPLAVCFAPTTLRIWYPDASTQQNIISIPFKALSPETALALYDWDDRFRSMKEALRPKGQTRQRLLWVLKAGLTPHQWEEIARLAPTGDQGDWQVELTRHPCGDRGVWSECRRCHMIGMGQMDGEATILPRGCGCDPRKVSPLNASAYSNRLLAAYRTAERVQFVA